MVGGFLSSYWIAFQLKYICLYVYDTLGTMQDYLFQKVYLKALHCIGSLNLFWFCFEVIIAFGRSKRSQLRDRYHYLIIQVLIYLRKSTFYRRVEEWNWWWSRIIKFSYTIVYLCQDIATIDSYKRIQMRRIFLRNIDTSNIDSTTSRIDTDVVMQESTSMYRQLFQ